MAILEDCCMAFANTYMYAGERIVANGPLVSWLTPAIFLRSLSLSLKKKKKIEISRNKIVVVNEIKIYILQDLPSAIYQIAEHLNIDVSDRVVNTIADLCQFDKMKSRPSVNSGWMDTSVIGMNKNYGGMIRRGKWSINLSTNGYFQRLKNKHFFFTILK